MSRLFWNLFPHKTDSMGKYYRMKEGYKTKGGLILLFPFKGKAFADFCRFFTVYKG